MIHVEGFRKRWGEPRGPLYLRGIHYQLRTLGYLILWSQFDGPISNATDMSLGQVLFAYYPGVRK